MTQDKEVQVQPFIKKAYSGAVNRLKSLWDNAILGDFRRFKEKLGLSSTAV
jgi:hypothetical protein